MYLFDVSIQSAFLGQEFATVRANHTFHPRMIFPEMFDHVLSWDATHRASFLCSVFGLAPGPRHNFALFANISIDLQMQEYRSNWCYMLLWIHSLMIVRNVASLNLHSPTQKSTFFFSQKCNDYWVSKVQTGFEFSKNDENHKSWKNSWKFAYIFA